MTKILGRAVALVAASMVVSTHSIAAPELVVSAQGDCPGQRELEAALTARGLALGGSKYLVTTHTDSVGVEMTLLRNGAEVVLTRRFSSLDCDAVSDAVAVVVEAYFVEVTGMNREVTAGNGGERSLPPPVTASDESALATEPPDANVRQPRRTIEAPLEVSGLLNRATPRAPNPSKPAGAPVPPADATAVSRAVILGVGFLGIGPSLSLPRGGLTAQLEAGGGIELPAVPLSTELQLATSWPSTSGGEPNRVRRWSSQGLVRVGLPTGNSMRYRPWVGLGITWADLRALDIAAAPSKATTAGLVGAGLEIAWPLAKGWRGRLDLGCLLLTTRDSYRVEPDGEIGRGPRVACSSMVGVGFGSTPARPVRESTE